MAAIQASAERIAEVLKGIEYRRQVELDIRRTIKRERDRKHDRARGPMRYWKDPEWFKAYHKRWRDANPDKRKAAEQKWRIANPDTVRNAYLKREHGITLVEYNAMFASQNFSCAICREPEPTGLNDKWHVDHCHRTNVVRGILCGGCNSGLGQFRDNATALVSAAEYIRRHSDGIPV